jgi:hypothetical protein
VIVQLLVLIPMPLAGFDSYSAGSYGYGFHHYLLVPVVLSRASSLVYDNISLRLHRNSC